VRDRVLHDQRAYAIGPALRQPESDRAAVVLHEERVVMQRQRIDEVRNDVREMIERVGELVGRRRAAVTEARVVGGDQAVMAGEQRHQRAVHARRRRKAVQQQDDGGVLRPRFAIEDVESIDRHAAVAHAGVRSGG